MLYLTNLYQFPRPIFNYKIFVDGELVKKDLPPGQTLSLDLSPGLHYIKARLGINTSYPYQVKVHEGQDIYLHTGIFFETIVNYLGFNAVQIRSEAETLDLQDVAPRKVNWVGFVYCLLTGILTIGASLKLTLGSGQTRGTVFLFGLGILAVACWFLKKYPFNPKSVLSHYYPYYFSGVVPLVLFWLSFSVQNVTAFWLIMGMVIIGVPVVWYSWELRKTDPNIQMLKKLKNSG